MNDPADENRANLRAEKRTRRRRWFQFSLRTLLVFVVVCAIPCAWLGSKIERKRKERGAVKAIVALHGTVRYDYQSGALPDGPRAEPFGPAWLRRLLGENFFSEVEFVQLSGGGVADAELVNLTGLIHLRRLELVSTNVTDAGLAGLRGLSEVEMLDLSNTEVTDAGLVNFNGLSQLQGLYLNGTDVTDAGVIDLGRFTQLQGLGLRRTKVSNIGLAVVGRFLQLQNLDLSKTVRDGRKITSRFDRVRRC